VRTNALNGSNSNDYQQYWPDQDKIRAWKQHSDHLIAQELGKKNWYESYSVQICEVKRQYNSIT